MDNKKFKGIVITQYIQLHTKLIKLLEHTSME